jgi:NAD(P)-dependent dehydrogenase (short-subunit alcohol dehydrogenase family)
MRGKQKMPTGIQGKVALVTGGASGIGRITGIEFARAGARVVVTTDANLRGAEETVQTIKDAGGEASFIRCNVSKEQDVEELVHKTVELYGSLDFAFNNAGVGPDGTRIPVVSIADCTEEVWDRTMNVNLKGVWLCMKHEIRQMTAQGHGAIVNTSSVGGLKALPGFGPYGASKSGVIGLTKCAALECARSGVRVNAVCPGPTGGTRLLENISVANPEKQAELANQIPMGRVGAPEEIARAVVWLCSDDAAFVTGHALSVDGGVAAS